MSGLLKHTFCKFYVSLKPMDFIVFIKVREIVSKNNKSSMVISPKNLAIL